MWEEEEVLMMKIVVMKVVVLMVVTVIEDGDRRFSSHVKNEFGKLSCCFCCLSYWC